MMDGFDVLLVDLQDLGCRIYTFITTLRYVLEEAATRRQGGVGARSPEPRRPTGGGTDARGPAGRASSARGPLPMRHGLTMGELARWFVATLRLDVDCQVVTDAGLAAAGRAGLRLAAGRAHLGEPESQRAEPVDGALLRRLR